jgi:hypothetical protein
MTLEAEVKFRSPDAMRAPYALSQVVVNDANPGVMRILVLLYQMATNVILA